MKTSISLTTETLQKKITPLIQLAHCIHLTNTLLGTCSSTYVVWYTGTFKNQFMSGLWDNTPVNFFNQNSSCTHRLTQNPYLHECSAYPYYGTGGHLDIKIVLYHSLW